jgi:hypothetical protein
MRKILFCLLLVSNAACAQTRTVLSWSGRPDPHPEKSNYEKTSTHADVMNFINTIKAKSPISRLQALARVPVAKTSRW